MENNKSLEEQFEKSDAGKAFRCLLLEVDESIQQDIKKKVLDFIKNYENNKPI